LQIADNVGVGPQTIALSGTSVNATSVPLPLWFELSLAGVLGLLIVGLRPNRKFGKIH
jgi:hypothetical protein